MQLRQIVLLVIITILSLAAAQVAFASPYPTVLSTFDASSHIYTYDVTVSGEDTLGFGYFEVGIPLPGIDQSWKLYGPDGWFADWRSADNNEYVAYWVATGSNSITRKKLGSKTWNGQFKIYAPNTQPIDTSVLTRGGMLSEHTIEEGIVGPSTVPEPGTIIAAMAILSPAALLFRRRNR